MYHSMVPCESQDVPNLCEGEKPMIKARLLVLAVSLTFGPVIGASDNPPEFQMPIRYYQIARLYGPGMQPSGEEGFHEKILRKPPGRVALVLVHTWNLGDGSSGQGAVVTHTYAATGVYTAVVTATNAVSTATATTTVTIVAPTYTIYLPVAMKP